MVPDGFRGQGWLQGKNRTEEREIDKGSLQE